MVQNTRRTAIAEKQPIQMFADRLQWERLEAEYETATPERREHINQLLDEMEFAVGESWLLQRDIERFRALGGDVDLYPAGR